MKMMMMFLCIWYATGLLFDSVSSIPQSSTVYSGHQWRRGPASAGLVMMLNGYIYLHAAVSHCWLLFDWLVSA